MNAVFETAMAAEAADLCVLPVREDGTKAPDVRSWTGYQRQRPDGRQIAAWFTSGRSGLGIVCGKVSGGLEMLEIEGRAVNEGVDRRLREVADDAGIGDLLDRVMLGYAERTPSGGIHLLYFVDEPRQNTKLASRPATPQELEHDPANKVRVLIETRGEGGFVIVAPSGGKVHPNGGDWALLRGGLDTIATITPEERDDLWAVARAIDETPVARPARERTDGDRPGDRFNAAPNAEEVILGLLIKSAARAALPLAVTVAGSRRPMPEVSRTG